MHTTQKAQFDDERAGVFLQCPHSICRHRWIYKGTMTVKALCPDCKGIVPIEKNKLSDSERDAFIKKT